MKIILVVLFPFLLLAQSSSASKWYYVTSSVLYGLTSGVSEGYRLEYEQGGNVVASKQELNAKWHNWKLASAPFIVGTGYTVALNSDMNLTRSLRGLYTSAVLAWISHDIAYNATRRYDLFQKSGSPLLPKADFPVKLVALGSVVLLELLFD